MPVPVFDLSRARRRLQPELDRRWARVLESHAFVLGPEVAEFEQSFAQSLGAAGCVGVGNGTDALVLCLRAMGAGPGDEILLPGFTFFATLEAVYLIGAQPVFVDVDEATYNLDLAAAERRLSPRTVGMIGVDLYGCPFDAPAAEAFCGRHGLWLVEDAAQAHGAQWGERAAGTFGQCATWSFYPSKNLGCFGDGGAVTARDAALLGRIRLLANHGQERRYHHVDIGTNSRLDSLQAAVLNCRLSGLRADNQRRAEIVARYREELAGVEELAFQTVPAGARSAYHLCTVRTPRRDQLKAHLERAGIGAAIHYPSAVPGQPAARRWADQLVELPRSVRAGREVLQLPLFPELEDDEVAQVCAAVRSFFCA